MESLIKNTLYKYSFFIIFFIIYINPTSISAQWDSLNLDVDYDFKAVHFITDDIGFLGGGTPFNVDFELNKRYGRILKTTDAGETWTEVLTEDSTFTWITDIDFVNASTGYASSRLSQVYKTVDQGETWTPVEYDGVGFTSPEIEMASEDVGFVIGWGGEIFRTENAGESWEEVLYLGSVPFISLDAIECIDIDTCYVGGHSSRLFKTTDGGDNWTQFLDFNVDVDIGMINAINCLEANDCMLSVRNVSNLYTSGNYGETWDTLVIPPLYSLEENQTTSIENFTRWDNTIYTVGKFPAIASSFDGGETWQSELDTINVPYIPLDRIHRTPNGDLYAVGRKGQVYVKYANPTNTTENHAHTLNIKAYPNPTSDIIHIEWSIPIINGKIIIYHSDGRKLKEQNINNQTKESIDISDLVNGFYYFSILNDEGVFMDNISVMKLE